MRKVCASVCLVSAVLAGGPAFAADAGAVLRSSHLLPSGAAEDCGPMHDDNAVPSRPAQASDSGQGRVERSPYGGNYCNSDAGIPARPGTQAHQDPSTPQVQGPGRPEQAGSTGQNGSDQNAPINPQAGYGGRSGSGTTGPTGGMS